MKIQAIKIKKWCDSYLTPLAWQRITLKLFPVITEKGISLLELQEPAQSLFFEEDELSLINDIVMDLYQMELPSQYQATCQGS